MSEKRISRCQRGPSGGNQLLRSCRHPFPGGRAIIRHRKNARFFSSPFPGDEGSRSWEQPPAAFRHPFPGDTGTRVGCLGLDERKKIRKDDGKCLFPGTAKIRMKKGTWRLGRCHGVREPSFGGGGFGSVLPFQWASAKSDDGFRATALLIF